MKKVQLLFLLKKKMSGTGILTTSQSISQQACLPDVNEAGQVVWNKSTLFQKDTFSGKTFNHLNNFVVFLLFREVLYVIEHHFLST